MTATSYAIGIDLGTTFTAAAVYREASAAIFLLGSRTATIPSLVFLRDDQAVLTGEAAERRGIVEPTRLAREFKRRVGDTAPIMLGQAPYSAERLMAALLKEVVAAVSTREGAQPAHVAVSHPANWGPFKIDLLRHALDLAGLRSVSLLTEPVAAAVHYASKERVEPDSTVAVYDLGGGTFDAAVLRKTATAFETLGEPEGIERLGGIDFDEAVFAYVRDQLQAELGELDGSDPSVRVAIGRLRRECVGAKEALSADFETTIPVALPNVHTDIRLTRAEFEPMIQPAIGETIEALRRAVERAGVRADDLDSVLLVGGSSQIPLVSQMVSSALGRPVAVDAHPKHSVALGAAVVAARAVASAPAMAGAAVAASAAGTARLGPSGAPGDSGVRGGSPGDSGVRDGSPGDAARLGGSPGDSGVRDGSPGDAARLGGSAHVAAVPPPPITQPPPPAPPGHPDAGGGDAGGRGRDDRGDSGRRRGRGGADDRPGPSGPVAHQAAPTAPLRRSGAGPVRGAGGAGAATRRWGRAAAVVALVVGATLGAYALGAGSGGDTAGNGAAADGREARDPDATVPPTTADPATAPCASGSGRCARITGIRPDGDRYRVDYAVESFDPLTPEHGGATDDHHVHFFFDTTPPDQAGTNSETRGPWTVWDRPDGDGALLFDAATVSGAEETGARRLCVLVADAQHGVEQGTGNCVDLPT